MNSSMIQVCVVRDACDWQRERDDQQLEQDQVALPVAVEMLKLQNANQAQAQTAL